MILQINNNSVILNEGLKDNEQNDFFNEMIPQELSEILSVSNGQKANTTPIFKTFKHGIINMCFFKYKFLSLDEIINTYKFIQSFANGKIDKQQIPFATIVSNTNFSDMKGTTALTIHKDNKYIYQTFSFIDNRGYKDISEIHSERFAKDLKKFLKNQIVWLNIEK